MTASEEPLACSLPLREAATQTLEWVELHEHALSRKRIPDGYRLSYPVEMAEIVEDLAKREAKCCGWLRIATQRSPEGITLEIASDHPHAGPVLDVLAGAD